MKHVVETGKVDIYPVGLLHDIGLAIGGLRARGHRFHYLKVLPRRIRSSWTRGSYWNGYLAEPTEVRAGLYTWTRCGHAWSRKRALRDLQRHMRDLAGGENGGG